VRARLPLALGAVAVCAACSSPPPPTEAQRTVDDTARGVRYVVPQGWKSFDGEIRSPRGSLLSVRVFSLAGADPAFVAGLPDTLIPQLEGEGHYYFIVEGKADRREATIGGGPATEFNYAVRIRQKDALSRTTYWVAKRGDLLYLLRATYPPRALEADEPAVREVVQGWRFPEAPKTSAPLPENRVR
jgi:hypothetical protein